MMKPEPSTNMNSLARFSPILTDEENEEKEKDHALSYKNAEFEDREKDRA